MKINKLLPLFFVFVLAFSLSVNAAPSQPIGVGGILTVDSVCIDSASVVIANIDTGETHTKTTENGGFYACALSATTGDVIKVSYDHEGTIYENTAVADTSIVTNWLNLTITIETEEEDDEENGGWTPSPPEQSNSPVADFTVSPEQPVIWDIITFTDISTDPNDDIIARTWDIDGHAYTTNTVQCAFLKSGTYSATLLVMDSEGNTDTMDKEITILDAPLYNSSDNSTGDDNDTTLPPPENITLTFEVEDQDGNPQCCTSVYVYDENNLLVVFAVTNKTGHANVSVPPGYYTINASYHGVTESKDMSFTNDGKVGFTLMLNGGTPPGGFNWWIVVVPSIITTMGIIGVFVWKKKYLVRSQ